MPTYEYACRACGHVFDIVQKMSDDRLTICPECGGELRKVFAPPAIAFKGSGFYATDHGKKKLNASSDAGEGDHKKKEEGTKEGAKEGGAAKEGGTKESGGSGTTSSTPAKDGGGAS